MRRTGPAIISWPRGNDRSHDCSGSGKETFSQGAFWTGYGQQTLGWQMLDGGGKTVLGGLYIRSQFRDTKNQRQDFHISSNHFHMFVSIVMITKKPFHIYSILSSVTLLSSAALVLCIPCPLQLLSSAALVLCSSLVSCSPLVHQTLVSHTSLLSPVALLSSASLRTLVTCKAADKPSPSSGKTRHPTYEAPPEDKTRLA